MPSKNRDVIFIGAGIVGAATARALLLRRPELRVVVLEKEHEPALHQTGHNSGVIHSGIYYRPGSLKARLCVLGARRMREFAVERGIPYQAIGKIIAATRESDLRPLETLWERAQANGVKGAQKIGPDEIREHEPHAAGIAGLWSPCTGIIDYAAVTRAYIDDIVAAGGEVITGAAAVWARVNQSGCVVATTRGDFEGGALVNCAGLYSDRVAMMTGIEPGVRIIPFRGEYYHLNAEAASLIRGCLYPVPNPAMPFLGVHFTRSVRGDVEAGPNAVLALAREGYSKTDIVPKDILETLAWRGFRKLSRRFWRTGVDEVLRSFSKARFAASLKELVPEIRPGHLAKGGSGVRAQAVDVAGTLVDDFHVIAVPRAIHVLNVPSPAATASLAIGETLAIQIEGALGK